MSIENYEHITYHLGGMGVINDPQEQEGIIFYLRPKNKHSLEEAIKILLKPYAKRPMQAAGVYDPMEQAGHTDMVRVSSVQRKANNLSG